jgi:hypothetical protein
MKMQCPQCQESFDNELLCPKCSVQLALPKPQRRHTDLAGPAALAENDTPGWSAQLHSDEDIDVSMEALSNRIMLALMAAGGIAALIAVFLFTKRP